MAKGIYLLQNNSAGYCGNAPYFWRKGGCGYTTDPDDAEQWTYQDARRQKRSTRGSHSWTIWNLKDIEAATVRYVDMQKLLK